MKKNGKTYGIYVAYDYKKGMQNGKKDSGHWGTNGSMSDYAKFDFKYNINKPLPV